MEVQVKKNNGEGSSAQELLMKKILKMSGPELKEYIGKIVLENPLMEIEESPVTISKKEDVKRKLEWLSQVDESNRVYTSQESEDYDNQDVWDDPSKGEDLLTYLRSQISAKKMDKKKYDIILFMMESLDSKGYMKEELKSIAKQFKVEEEEVKQVLQELQSLDPAGIAARNLKECLILQLERLDTDEELTKKIVESYLELMGKGETKAIAEEMNIGEEQIIKCIRKIKKLNPKPANGFASRERLAYIVPDITVVKLAGYFEILLNEYLYPGISVNSYYKDMLKQDCSEEVRDYIVSKMEEVESLQHCIAARNRLLVHIANMIVNEQSGFFLNGHGLAPVGIEDAAVELGVPEHVIRWAVRGKYLQCTWGIYPINYFFAL